MSSKNFNLIDKDGEWVVNTSQFRLAATRGTPEQPEVIHIESGVPTKVVMDDYLKSQPLLVPCPDPVNSDEPVPAVIVPGENTLIPTDEHGKPDTAHAPGVIGTTAETAVTGNPPTGSKRK
jgi:hypothetical protein